MVSDTPSISPRAARTRAALLSAGLDLLVERPVDAIAIDEVVAAAGVAKGSFFNHFEDKRSFAQIIAEEIRSEIEARVTSFNKGRDDPLERLSGGMISSAGFALTEPKRTAVLLRSGRGMTWADHPLNKGVRDDIRLGLARGLLRDEAEGAGYLFWIGCCQTVMSAFVEHRPSEEKAVELLRDMLVLGLNGLGAPTANVVAVVDPLLACAGRLGNL